MSSFHTFPPLAFHLPLQDFQLEAQTVYVRAGHRLIKHRHYSGVRQLLKCVGESGTATRHDCDTLILSCVSAAEKTPADVSDGNAAASRRIGHRQPITAPVCLLLLIQAKELEALVLETKSTESKVTPLMSVFHSRRMSAV